MFRYTCRGLSCQGFIFSLPLWEVMLFSACASFFNKREGFLFFASSLVQLLPTLELVSFVDDPCRFVFLTYLDNQHFNYVVTSGCLSWNISLGVGRWHEREGTQEGKLVMEVGWNLPCCSCIAPNFLPSSAKEDEEWVCFTYAGLWAAGSE